LIKNNYAVIIRFMTLLEFWLSMTVEQREAFAKRCSTSPQHLKNIAYDKKGIKTANESLCINIERESKGKVRCESLRPDVDWAYLRQTKKAA
jgi:DNA-binding transcriptional regulator YdaS (Cro superfamily)